MKFRHTLFIAVILTLHAITSVMFAGVTCNFTGYVLDHETKTPIANATVYVKGTNYKTTSKKDGSYLLQNVPAGQCNLSVEKNGYNGYTVTKIVAIQGMDNKINFRPFKQKEAATSKKYKDFNKIEYISAENDTSLSEQYEKLKLFTIEWGTGDGELGRIKEDTIRGPMGQGPTGIVVDENGNVHILDIVNHRILIFHKNGSFKKAIIFERNSENKTMDRGGPKTWVNHLDLDKKNNYVIDGVYVFNGKGKYLGRIKDIRSTRKINKQLNDSSLNVDIYSVKENKTITNLTINLPNWYKKANTERRYKSAEILSVIDIDQLGNLFVTVSPIEQIKNDSVEIIRYSTIVNKYSPKGLLLSQIGIDDGSSIRYLSKDGFMYELFYNIADESRLIVYKWVLRK